MTDKSADFLTDGQLCALVQVSPKTTQRWRLNGDGPPFVRAGRKNVLYRRSDVDTWIESRTYKHRAAEATAKRAA